MNDLTSEWAKMLFAYGPMGFFTLACLIGLIWLARNVIKPGFDKHMALVDTVTKSQIENTNTLKEMKEGQARIEKSIDKQTDCAIIQTATISRIATNCPKP